MRDDDDNDNENEDERSNDNENEAQAAAATTTITTAAIIVEAPLGHTVVLNMQGHPNAVRYFCMGGTRSQDDQQNLDKQRLIGRLELWLSSINLTAKQANEACNFEAKRLKCHPIFPNLSQIATDNLDCFGPEPWKNRMDVEFGGYTLKLKSLHVSAVDSVLNLMVTNATEMILPHTDAKPCGSMSELNQTPYYTNVAQSLGGRKLVSLFVYADGTRKNTSLNESVHPIDVEIGYGRALGCFKFASTRATIGWMPDCSKGKVTLGTTAVTWLSVPLTARTELRRLVIEQVTNVILNDLEILCGSEFDFGGELGTVCFKVFQFKGDHPEKRDWVNITSRCFVCTKPDQICLHDQHFHRFSNSQTKSHYEGTDVSTWATVSPNGEAHDIFAFPDSMVSH